VAKRCPCWVRHHDGTQGLFMKLTKTAIWNDQYPRSKYNTVFNQSRAHTLETLKAIGLNYTWKQLWQRRYMLASTRSCTIQVCKEKDPLEIIIFYLYLFIYLFFVGLGFKLWVSHLQSRCCTTRATAPVHFGVVTLEMVYLKLFAWVGLAWNGDPLDLNLPSS
jgi:hypothetical protein